MSSLQPVSPLPVKRIFSTLALILCTGLANAADAPASGGLFGATLADVQDHPVAMQRYKGQPLVVNFWARWCPPCRAEMPELVKFRAAQRGRIEVIGIGIENDAAAVRDFLRANGIDFPVFVAREQGFPLMQSLGNGKGALPYTVFIGRDGRVLGSKLGRLAGSDLEAAAKLLLAP